MQQSARKRLWQNVGLAWGLALLVVVGVFRYWGISPLGNHSLLMSDMGTQYIPFLTAMQHAFKYQVFHLYTFSQSLGSSVVPTVAYYLLSPFNLIVVFFSADQVPVAASLIIMLKIATIAATMSWYLQRHFHTTQRLTIAFALAFSFCGFVALNYFDFMWLDALIILPLVAAGIDRLVWEQRPGRFFAWLLASILTNYYLGYMTCLFAVLYFAYVFYDWLTTRQPDQSKAWWGRLTQFTLSGLLSGLSAAIVLIPTGLGMLLTAKQTPDPLNFRIVPEFGLEFFTQFGVGAANYTQRLWHAPTVFVTSAVALLVLVYFVHPQISRRQKWSAGALLITLFLAMWVRVFNTVWHLMQAPAGFPFRNVFFFSFVMVMLAFAAWQKNPRAIRRGWQWGLPVGQVVTMVLGARLVVTMVGLVRGHSAKLAKYYGNIQQVHWQSLAIATAYVIVTALVIFATQGMWRKWLLSGLILTEVGGNFILTMGTTSFGNQAAYVKAYQNENRQMGRVNDPDGQLYRVQNDNTLINRAYHDTYNNYNDSQLFNFHGVAAYSSTLTEQTRRTLKQLGLASDNVRRISSAGLTPLTELLLGIKDTVHLTTNGAQTTPTSSYSGMGFAVSSALANVKLGTNALRNQEAVMQALVPSKQAYFAQAKLGADQVKHVTEIKGVRTTYPYHHGLKLTATTNGPAYMWVTGATKFSTMQVDGKTIGLTPSTDGHELLVKLGNFKRGQAITVKFAAKYPDAVYKMQVMSLRTAAFDHLVQTVRQQSLTLHTVASHLKTELVGRVSGSASRQELFLSIPYDAGWQATVNGQRVTPHRLLNGLMGISLQRGTNDIWLSYHVPGGHLGIGVSALSVVAFGVLDWRWRRGQRRQQE
ncbi:YfhO family protein [Levilactobacillus enshiensis]|uniref:YfhO family protein n=1 Tax=Levilactobacillus enshiensis TaxID=2590213 RepID=UPI00117B25F9|nr:YfhO family protein [Levilactobacillus enshiensis]